MFQTLLVLLVSVSVHAESFTKTDWEGWKKQTYKNALESPKSFLNATSLASATKGKRLYLAPMATRQTTKWSSKPVSGFVAIATFKGNHVTLTRPRKKDVTLKPGNSRFDWKLDNGAIAEVVYSERSKKMFGYIYDPDQIKRFTGFKFYPFNQKAVVKGTFVKKAKKFVSYKTVQGDPRKVSKVGEVTFQIHGKTITLDAYNWQYDNEIANYFALIFTDQKSGVETYAGGRELSIDVPGGKGLPNSGEFTLDFNRTTNFYCAHSPFWHCPTGLQQKIGVAVEAGEMLPEKKIAKAH